MTFIISHLAYKSLRYPALETIELSDYYWAIRSWRSNMFSKTRKLLFLSLIVVLLSTVVSACSTSKSSDVHLYMMPMDQMPADVQAAPVAVQEAYQFASINPDVMNATFQMWMRREISNSTTMRLDVRSVWTSPRMSCGCCKRDRRLQKPGHM